MGILSAGHWIIVALVVFLLFGPGRLSGIMGDLGQGLRSFRRELDGDEQRDQAGGQSPVVPQSALIEPASRQIEPEGPTGPAR